VVIFLLLIIITIIYVFLIKVNRTAMSFNILSAANNFFSGSKVFHETPILACVGFQDMKDV